MSIPTICFHPPLTTCTNALLVMHHTKGNSDHATQFDTAHLKFQVAPNCTHACTTSKATISTMSTPLPNWWCSHFQQTTIAPQAAGVRCC